MFTAAERVRGYATNRVSTSDGLPEQALRGLDEIGEADALVGIPCFENEETIGGVVAAVEAGLRTHVPDLRSVICVSDGGSTDRTRDRALEAGTAGGRPAVGRAVFEYVGPSGKGSAVRAIFEAATRLGVRACALVDADLRSITPTWVGRLLAPIVRQGFGFVAPVYARHKHDGTITNSLAYPVTTALYGARIRQPIGGEFGLSGELAGRLAARDVWQSDVARFGIDIWMTTTAVVEGVRVCQAILGAKVHDPKDPGSDLEPMFRQVVGSLFALAGGYHDRWAEIDAVVTPPTFGSPAAADTEPVIVSIPRLVDGFLKGAERHRELWRRVVSADAMAEIEQAMAGAAFEDEAWFTIVYDYLVASGAGDIEAGLLLDSLLPLYFARTARFVERTRNDTPEEAEARVEAGVDAAVALKPYLVERWAAAGARPAPA
jgi:glucosylglycerate synthase